MNPWHGEFLKEHELTLTENNVPRIGRFEQVAGWSCKEVGENLLRREPDITRLLGRLEKKGLISRKLDAEAEVGDEEWRRLTIKSCTRL